VHATLMFWIWVVLCALFIIGEVFTAGFYLFPFAVGTGVAAILSIVGVAGWIQWLAFIVISSALVVSSRRLVDRFTKEPPERVNVDRLVGEVGLVIEPIEPVADSGRVRVKKDECRAESADNSRIEKNARVRVLRIEGAHLVVEKVEGNV
jgi:membrane protein implicated in regulation of membrane protease activity